MTTNKINPKPNPNHILVCKTQVTFYFKVSLLLVIIYLSTMNYMYLL